MPHVKLQQCIVFTLPSPSSWPNWFSCNNDYAKFNWGCWCRFLCIELGCFWALRGSIDGFPVKMLDCVVIRDAKGFLGIPRVTRIILHDNCDDSWMIEIKTDRFIYSQVHLSLHYGSNFRPQLLIIRLFIEISNIQMHLCWFWNIGFNSILSRRYRTSLLLYYSELYPSNQLTKTMNDVTIRTVHLQHCNALVPFLFIPPLIQDVSTYEAESIKKEKKVC